MQKGPSQVFDQGRTKTRLEFERVFPAESRPFSALFPITLRGC